MASMKKTSSILRWLTNLLLVVTSITFLFLVGEIFLAFFLPNPIIWLDPQESYIYHPKLMHRLKPNQRAFTHSFPVTTNSHGLRTGEFPLKRNSHTFRILCLGDSLTFGNGVRTQETYPQQLEAMLNSERNLKRVKVINAGVPAYDTWQEAIYLREYGLQFSPDVVIIGFYVNDITPRPKVIRNKIDESGFRRKHTVQKVLSFELIHLLKRSRVLLLLRDRFRILADQLNPSFGYRRKLALLNGGSEPLLDQGFQEVNTSFREMADLATNHEFRLLLVIFPMPDQLLGEYPNATYQSKVKEIARRYGIPYIDLKEAFHLSFHGFGSLFTEWDGHPNARAYKITASQIKEYLLGNGIILNHKDTRQSKEPSERR
jgi:lysophospholipase L1-like esterase